MHWLYGKIEFTVKQLKNFKIGRTKRWNVRKKGRKKQYRELKRNSKNRNRKRPTKFGGLCAVSEDGWMVLSTVSVSGCAVLMSWIWARKWGKWALAVVLCKGMFYLRAVSVSVSVLSCVSLLLYLSFPTMMLSLLTHQTKPSFDIKNMVINTITSQYTTRVSQLVTPQNNYP